MVEEAGGGGGGGEEDVLGKQEPHSGCGEQSVRAEIGMRAERDGLLTRSRVRRQLAGRPHAPPRTIPRERLAQASQYRLRAVMRRPLLETAALPPQSRYDIPGVNLVCGLLALRTRTHDPAFQSSPFSRRAWLCNIVA
eukprot:824237-Pyramimonas_sp.AAC.1